MTAATLQKPFVISRDLQAPRELVFKAFTDAEHLKNWWGPKGSVITYIKADVRAGGVHHYCLRMSEGSEVWGKQVYREVTPHTRIVLVSAFSDKDGNLTRHPMAPVWPLEMLTTFTFDDIGGGKTRLTVTWLPITTNEDEYTAFDQMRDSMTTGWTGTFEQLEAYVATF